MAFVGGVLGLLIGLACFMAGLALYFLPALLAIRRRKANATLIFLMNLALGWTLIGWLVALIWAISRNQPKQVDVSPPSGTTASASALCMNCGKYIPAAMKFCPRCGTAMTV